MTERTYRIASPMEAEAEGTREYGDGSTRTVSYEGTTKVVTYRFMDK